MIRYFLRNSKQEVKVGDRITISVPTSTPYGQAKCEVEVVVTQDSLKQLIKDGLVVAQEERVVTLEDYKPFIRRLARRSGITYPQALELLDSIKEVSIYAHNALLLELMAEVMNNTHDRKNLMSTPVVNIVHPMTLEAAQFTPEIGSRFAKGGCPHFVSLKDAEKAANLMRPFYEEAARRRKQED